MSFIEWYPHALRYKNDANSNGFYLCETISPVTVDSNRFFSIGIYFLNVNHITSLDSDKTHFETNAEWKDVY